MINASEALLASLNEGDVFETPPLLPGLSSEPIVWKVLEHARDINRLTVHGYYEGVFIGAAGIKVFPGQEPQWSFA